MYEKPLAAICRISVALMFYIILPFPVFAADRFENYWTVNEYLSNHSDQIAKSEAFVKRVRAPAMKIGNSNKLLKIAIVYPGLQVSDYWKRSILSFEARLQEMDLNYELLSHFTKPGQAVHEQSKKIGQFLSSGADYLIFTLNVNRHKALIDKVMARAGIKVILQNITTPLKAFKFRQPFQYVGFDHAIGTGYLAEKYLDIFKGTAEYAIFYGPPGYVSEMRGGTFLRHMQAHEGMALKASYYVDFDRRKSYRASLDLLEAYPNIKFIFSTSTDIALGVIDALRETGKMGQVITNGWGGGSLELEAIQKGELEFTVMRMNDDNGVAMAEAILMDQQGKSADVPTIFSGDMVLIEKRMNNSEIIGLKKRAFRYSK